MPEEPLTVVIADDEVAARRYLRRQLQAYDLDLEITGEAGTGPDLLDLLGDGAPDVLMLDIMMPGFSGLEALERLHGQYRDMRVLIISAYDRFNFAQDAVRLGVEDFLVKPVRPPILRKSFIDCVQKVYRARKRVARHLRMRERATLADRAAQDALVRRLLSDHDAKGQLEAMGFPVPRALLVADVPQAAGHDLDAVMAKWVGNRTLLWCLLRPGRAVVMLPAGEIVQVAEDLLSTLSGACASQVRLAYTGAVDSTGELRDAYRSACVSLNLAYITDQQLVPVAQAEPVDGDVRGVLSMEERLASEVRSGSLEEASRALQELTRVAVQQGDDAGFLETELVAAVTSACQVACSHMAEPKTMLQLRHESIRAILQAGTPEEMVRISRECLERIFDGFRSVEDRKHRLVTAARTFIEDNVGSSLSLDEVAKSVHVSSYYLSRVFTEVCGHSFSEYLTSLRLERSKELLRHSDLSCGDVGLRVGYSSASYFSQVFKQHVGMTPSQYRDA